MPTPKLSTVSVVKTVLQSGFYTGYWSSNYVEIEGFGFRVKVGIRGSVAVIVHSSDGYCTVVIKDELIK